MFLPAVPEHLGSLDISPKKADDASSGLETFREVGVLVYQKSGPDYRKVVGTFALPMYQGQLAEEILIKQEGQALDVYDGVYDMETLTPEDSPLPKVAAKGTLTIKPMDSSLDCRREGVCREPHWIIWDFAPEPWLNKLNGWSNNDNRLRYIGVGIETEGPEPDSPLMVAAWSNNVFSRTWRHDDQEYVQYAVCGTAVPADGD